MAEAQELRVQPHDLVAEQSVLGAIFINPEKLITVREFIEADDFYKYSHRVIFKAMVTLSDRNDAIDATTVRTILDDQDDLQNIGGISYLVDLVNSVPTSANAEYYAKIVAEKAMLRRIINRLTEIVNQAYEGTTESDEIIANAEKALVDVSEHSNSSGFRKISEVLDVNFNTLEMRSQQTSDVTGLPTGFRDLDKITTGLHPDQLIILAARPAMGKTAFALNIAHNAAYKSKEPVAIFSLEMPAEQLVQRIICSMGSIEGASMRTGEVLKTNANKYYAAAERVSKCNLYIDDSPGIKINDIVAKSRKLKSEHGLKMIVIDYLQLITSSSKNRENRQQEVSEISRTLKALARELEVPVISLSQLSRSVEQRPNKRPMMSDLRESGAIEQDADIVSFIYREDYYKNNEDNKTEETGLTEIIIAKHRNGATGEVNLAFEKNYSRFSDLAHIGPDGTSDGIRDIRS